MFHELRQTIVGHNILHMHRILNGIFLEFERKFLMGILGNAGRLFTVKTFHACPLTSELCAEVWRTGYDFL